MFHRRLHDISRTCSPKLFSDGGRFLRHSLRPRNLIFLLDCWTTLQNACLIVENPDQDLKEIKF